MIPNNTLIHDNCFNVFPNIDDKSIDMILCDLPYGTTQCKWDSVLPLDKLWLAYNRIIKDNGCIALFAQTPFNITLGSSNIKQLRYEWIWEKNKATGHLNAKKMPLKAHENILVFYNKLPTYNPQLTEGTPYIGRGRPASSAKTELYGKYGGHREDNPGFRYPRSVLRYGYVTKALHPTQKPIDLLEYLIKTYTNEGELVLDNTCGVASTCLAAKNTNRNYIGIEMDKTYYEIGLERLK